MRTLAKIVLGLLGAAVLAGAGGLALSWAPERPVSDLKAQWAPPPSTFLEVAGMSVHLRDEGPRDPVSIVLLHGTSASLHTWNDWARALADARRVIRFDLPGNGFSPLPSSGPVPTEAGVRLVLDFIDQQIREPAFLIGNSLGGAMRR